MIKISTISISSQNRSCSTPIMYGNQGIATPWKPNAGFAYPSGSIYCMRTIYVDAVVSAQRRNDLTRHLPSGFPPFPKPKSGHQDTETLAPGITRFPPSL